MRRVQQELKGVNVPFKVAVMGCVVNAGFCVELFVSFWIISVADLIILMIPTVRKSYADNSIINWFSRAS